MTEGMLAVFIPIIMFLVIGLVLVTFIYFRSRERQMLIDKGLDAEAIKKFFEGKKDPFIMLKWGMIILGFGIGLGLGMMLEEETGREYWIPFLLFSFTGVGFILANLVGNKLNKKEKSEEQHTSGY